MMSLLKYGLAFLLAFASLNAYAANFFNVTSTGTSLQIRTNIPNHTYPSAGIKITSPGFSLTGMGSECSMSGNGFCLFSASNSQTKTLSIAGTGTFSAILCLNGKGPLSCQDYSHLSGGSPMPTIPATVYVANYLGSPSVSLCTLDSNGQINSCTGAGGEVVLSGHNIEGAVLSNDGTMMYLTGFNSTNVIYQCSINPANGMFNTCSAVTVTAPIGYQGGYGLIALNPAGTYGFFPDGGSARVLACPISGGNISGTCVNTGATNISGNASGITFNSAGTVVYIASYDLNSVTVCSVSGTAFSSCTAKTGGSSLTFNQPGASALNKDESIVYITSFGDNTVYGCSTASNPGASFASCFVASAAVSNPWIITIDQTGTLAYVSDFSNTVSVCPIMNDGTFGTCTAKTGFGDPIAMALSYTSYQ